MHHYSFARQPILDLDLKVYGYEFLYRPNVQSNESSHSITSEVLASSIIDLGLDKASNDKFAFINMSYEDIMSEHVESLPADRLILELLEDIKPDPVFIQRISSLQQKGFSFALDDFIYTPDWDPLIEMASIIKFDLTTTTLKENKALIQKLRTQNISFLAEKVETHEDFSAYRDIGCQLFQGYFFCKPEHIQGKATNASSNSKVKLIATINKVNISFEELEKAIEQDPTTTYMLLKYLNSAHFAFAKRIESIKQALVMLGLENVKKWATLITLRNMSSKPSELLRVSLLRAKIAELIAVKNKLPNTSGFFLTGLLSTIDALLDTTMETIIPTMSLASDISAALLKRQGIMGETLTTITEYEAQRSPANATDISDAYIEACQWTDQVLGAFEA
jgi:EAL and modified HD-GYP domain-containing signal transduction protein